MTSPNEPADESTSNSASQTMPAELGFRMPPEWYPHQATWMASPHNKETWPENLAEAQAELVR